MPLKRIGFADRDAIPRGSLGSALRDERGAEQLVRRALAEQPRTIRQWMNTFDLACFRGEPEGLRHNAEETRGLAQIEPRLVPVRRRPEDRDLVMRPERGNPLARPAIAMAGHQAVPVENAGNQVIIGDKDQLAHSSDDVG